MEYNINPPKHSQKNEADAKPSNTETRGTNHRKKKRPHRSPDKRSSSKEVHHQKYINSKIPISEKMSFQQLPKRNLTPQLHLLQIRLLSIHQTLNPKCTNGHETLF